MIMVFKGNKDIDINYSISINSKPVKEIDFTQEPCKIEAPVNESVILIELNPIYNKKQTFADRLKSFIGELIGLFVWFFYVISGTKEKLISISDFSDYMQLYGKKALELSVNNNSAIFFEFRRSPINKKEKLYKITPTVEKFTNLKILKNEENIVFNNTYIRKKLGLYLFIYSLIYLPPLVMLLIGAIDSVIKENLPLLILLLTLFCGFLIFYLFSIFRTVKVYKLYNRLRRQFK